MFNKLKPKSEFSSNVLTLMTGTTIAQAIPIAISPILTRIYTPEDFGIFALYMSVATIISVVATGGYEHAIMLPKKDEDAVNIVALSVIISCFVSFLVLLMVFVFNSQITSILGNPEISSWLYFVPITVLFSGIYQSFNYWTNRKKYYKRLSGSKIVQSGTTVTTNLVLGFNGVGSAGLILGSIFGQISAIFVLGKNILIQDNKVFKNINKFKIIMFARKYIDFFKFSTFSSILNTLSFSLFTILLSKVFSIAILGFYSLIYRILTLPSALVGNSISQVYFQESTIQKKKFGNNKNIFKVTIKKLTLISVLVYLPMYFYIEELVIFVFGGKWHISGEIAKILIPLMFIRFISSVMSSTLTTYEKQKPGLFINFILAFSVIVIFGITYTNKLGLYQFFYLYVFIMSMWYFLFLGYYYRLSKGKE